MAFDRPTLKVIYDRVVADMEARITAATPGVTQVKIKRVSLLGILAAVIAGVAHMLYGYLDYLSKQLFPDTSEEEWLVRDAGIRGITMRAATAAVGTVQFTGTNGFVVPTGTLVQNISGVQYSTDTDVEIVAGVASVSVTAVEFGVDGNSALTDLTLVNPVAGINSSAIFTVVPDGGSDKESLDSFRSRYIRFLQQPPAGGRAYDYEAWALSVDGITRAWGIDAYNGAGTVGVVVADGNSPVSSLILQNCYDYIMTQRPMGVLVTVANIAPVVFDLWIDLPSGEYNKGASITSQLQTLFNDESGPGETILISHINASILSSTVSDYAITAIEKDGTPIAVGNLTTSGVEIAVLGTVTYGVL